MRLIFGIAGLITGHASWLRASDVLVAAPCAAGAGLIVVAPRKAPPAPIGYGGSAAAPYGGSGGSWVGAAAGYGGAGSGYSASDPTKDKLVQARSRVGCSGVREQRSPALRGPQRVLSSWTRFRFKPWPLVRAPPTQPFRGEARKLGIRVDCGQRRASGRSTSCNSIVMLCFAFCCIFLCGIAQMLLGVKVVLANIGVTGREVRLLAFKLSSRARSREEGLTPSIGADR